MENRPPNLIEAVSLEFFYNFNIAFFDKGLHLAEEKDNPLGFEPVLECLPSARFKSRENVVH